MSILADAAAIVEHILKKYLFLEKSYLGRNFSMELDERQQQIIMRRYYTFKNSSGLMDMNVNAKQQSVMKFMNQFERWRPRSLANIDPKTIEEFIHFKNTFHEENSFIVSDIYEALIKKHPQITFAVFVYDPIKGWHRHHWSWYYETGFLKLRWYSRNTAVFYLPPHVHVSTEPSYDFIDDFKLEVPKVFCFSSHY